MLLKKSFRVKAKTTLQSNVTETEALETLLGYFLNTFWALLRSKIRLAEPNSNSPVSRVKFSHVCLANLHD